ncbi:SMP-30/gluconolactonase/LRE family protein [Actinomadura sp. 9N407]|uniref:SMP-30/gluconolactonase/LRE family protein n=1 Tax=Actinomadura sp. 9N407 TaxID=3375154 RepID=UPI0037A4160F
MKIKLSSAVLAVVAAGTAALTTVTALPASAAATPDSRAKVIAHFDLDNGQMPENVAVEPGGALNVTFAAARQIARVDRTGATRILATLPLPADGGVGTPVLGFPLTTGIVRTRNGTLYVLYAAGSADMTGLWRLTPGGTPQRIAALPAEGLPNGLALDERGERFYITDSVLGKIWTVPRTGGTPAVWSAADDLASTSFLGVNGAKARDGALWVTNLDKGTVLRIPFRKGGRAGLPQVKATGLVGLDDFAFTGRGEEIVAAVNGPNKVVRIRPGGAVSTVLDAADGLQNPTSVAVRGGKVYVLSAAYTTKTDPNLLQAHLPGRR